tara:strand:+ start:2468 stop:3790 length:1323 start_codon:yes stop_codon:yes gene_type:complete
MKFFYLIILFFIFGCSFDNKTGIWKNENIISKKKNDPFEDFVEINVSNNNFKKIIAKKKGFKLKLEKPINNFSWHDVYYSENNNLKNFTYDYNLNHIYRSKKISRNNLDNNFLYSNENLIFTDTKGDIIIFSIGEKRVIYKFNFYKKKYKNVEKKLNIILNEDLLYVFDNIGYIYALDINNNKIVWANKNDVPFRSNIKVYKNKLISSDQNNKIYFINKKDGKILTIIPTEETLVKNKFENNLSVSGELTFFINTFGSLYAINNKNMRIIWFINLNQSIDLNPSNIFYGNQIISNGKNLVLSSNDYTYIIDQFTGTTIYKKNFSSNLKPIIIGDFLFIITKEKLLICTNIVNGEIVYSYDINNKIAEFLNTKKYDVKFKHMMILNNKLIVFLKNSYFLIFNTDGELEQVNKLPKKINSFPIVINNSLIYLDTRNKISIID